MAEVCRGERPPPGRRPAHPRPPRPRVCGDAGLRRRHRGEPARIHPRGRPVPPEGPARVDGRRPAGHAGAGVRTRGRPGPSRRTSSSSSTGRACRLAGLEVAVAHAPGHTEGSVMFTVPDLPSQLGASSGLSATCLSGDVLFAGSIGRTDLAGGVRRGHDALAAGRGPADGRRHAGAARPRPLDDDRAGAGHEPLFARIDRVSAPTEPGDPDQRVPGVPARRPHRRAAVPRRDPGDVRAARVLVDRDAARSSRSSGSARRARTPTRRSTACRGWAASPDDDDARWGLHFDLTVPFARYVRRERGPAVVPVPALPDPEGVAGGAAAGGPVPRVHPGRHRRRGRRFAGAALRGGDAARRGRRVLTVPGRRVRHPGEQPEDPRGLLPRRSG